MCWCNPSRSAPTCICCVEYLAHQVKILEAINAKLIKALGDEAHTLTAPPPMIVCKDCPNFNLIEKRLDELEDNWSRRHEP